MVKEYHVLIDLENHVIMHDCADWSKTLHTKRLCKHLDKLLMVIDKEKASTILREIYSHKENWEFKPYAQQQQTKVTGPIRETYTINQSATSMGNEKETF